MTQLVPAIQSSTGRSKPFAGAQLINMYAEQREGDSKTQLAALQSPGLALFSTLAGGPVRGMIRMAGIPYVVSGNALYSVDSSGIGASIGAVAGSGLVRMATNGTQIAIAASGTGYIATASAVAAITDVDFPSSVMDVAYVDGYFAWITEDGEFVISSLLDGTAYDGADFATAEGAPDDLRAIIANHRELHLLGEDSMEIWYNSGDPDFPFERQGNAFMERGCYSRDTVVALDNSIFWLGDDGVVYRQEGYSPVRISTHDVEYWIDQETVFEAFAYPQEGHKFYVLSTASWTKVFDVATGLWHDRKSLNLNRWRARGFVECYNKRLVGDYDAGKIYELDLDVFTENGEEIRSEIVLPPVHQGRERFSILAFEVDMETGVGTSGQGADPQIMLQYSRDSGRTWSNELWRDMGATGDYKRRAIWRKLGQFRQCTIKLAITDPVKRAVIGYHADIE